MKASGSTPSLIRGVSQQVPEERQLGQHTEQINLRPDPIQGLSRRFGSKWQAETQLPLNHAVHAAYVTDTESFRTFDFTYANKEYSLLYRSAGRAYNADLLPVVVVYNRTDKEFLSLTKAGADLLLAQLEAGGVSAVTSIGKFVFFAGHSITPASSSSAVWASAGNQNKAALWIRGGAYSRTFTVTLKPVSGSPTVLTYTTPDSAYQGTLDTAGIPVYMLDSVGGTQTDTISAYIRTEGADTVSELAWYQWSPSALTAYRNGIAMTNTYPAAPTTATQFSYNTGDRYVKFAPVNLGATNIAVTYTHAKTVPNPNYGYEVANLTNAYNSAVTAWIGSASAASQPDAIAEELRALAVGAGFAATRQGSHVLFTDVVEIVADDGGDGSLVRGVDNEINSVDQVSAVHWVGKVVKVRARSSENAYYLRATAKDSTVLTGFTEVTWVEGAGVEHSLSGMLVYGTPIGSTFYMASTASGLQSITGLTDVPDFSSSTVGDNDSSPLPYFVGRKITYLGVFQDRLLVGSGGVLRASKVGEYLNFFRSSVLTAPADDPLEILAQGSEDDELRHSVLYDRDLVVFGNKRQYAVSGRTPLTPTSALLAPISSHAHAASLPPIASGGFIFYAKLGEKDSSVHQIQPGINPESPESFPVSSQIDTYLDGACIEMATISKPTALFLRTTGKRSSLFVFDYLDTTEGRKQDAWNRWDFHEDLGPIIGLSGTTDGVLIFSLRYHTLAGGGTAYSVVADLCPMTTGLASYPYLDSVRPLGHLGTVSPSLHSITLGPWYVAFDGTSEYAFIGDALAEVDTLLDEFPDATGPQAGITQEAVFIPTNPMVLDRNGKAITSGRLTITKLLASFKNSSGFSTDILANRVTETVDYLGRVMGALVNVVGREPVSDYQQSIPVGRETREYKLTIRSRTWLPFTLTSLEWVGQLFNRTQRF